MRLIVLVLMFCFSIVYSLAQETSAPIDLIMADNADFKSFDRAFRLGIVYKIDQKPLEDYHYIAADVVSKQVRQPFIGLEMIWQPLLKVPHVLLHGNLSYQADHFMTSSEGKDNFTGYSNNVYSEQYHYKRIIANTGIRLELVPKGQFTPYVGFDFVFALPLHFQYDFKLIDGSPDLPATASITDGVYQRPGWEFSAGLRFCFFNKKIHGFIAFYQTEQKIYGNWPRTLSFPVTNPVLSFFNRGMTIGFQYAL